MSVTRVQLVGNVSTGASFAGIVTATSFVGSGANLTGLVAGVGIQSAGSVIGSGITTLNFIGTGNTFSVSGSTANISIAGGSGGSIGTTGITTQTVFSNPNIISVAQSLTNPNHNYGMFGPVSIGATVTVGAGNTFVIV